MAAGDRIQVATKPELDNVANNVNTVDQKITAAETGLLVRTTTLESSVETVESDVSSLKTTVGDENSGLVKTTADLYSDIHETGTGLKDRVTDLEQGGTATMKFRTHIPAGVYEDGEVVQRNGKLYKSNAAIDGSSTPVPFVEGTTGGTWSELSSASGTAYYAAEFDSSGKLVASSVTRDELSKLSGVTANIQGQLTSHAEAIINRAPKGYSSNPTINARMAVIGLDGAVDYGSLTSASVAASVGRTSTALGANTALVSDASGVVTSSAVTATELGYLDGVTSNIQTQLAGKTYIGYVAKPTTNDRVALVTTAGSVNWTDVTKAEIDRVKGVTSGIQAQINGKLTAPTHASMTTYGTNDGLRIKSTQPNIVFATNGSDECYISGGGHFRPLAAGQDIGQNSTAGRWSTIYLKNSPNVSSDEDLKTDIKQIPNELLDVWFDYVQPLSYTLKSNAEKKTNVIEVGMIAQDVIAAFEAAGIDWHEWNVVSEGADLDSDDEPLVAEKDDYYSLNYTACQLIEAMAIRHKLGIKPSARFRNERD